MALIKPFKGLRPPQQFAAEVAAPPYDVLNREEALEQAEGNPCSFLHINKPEIDMDSSIDVHDQRVYQKGSENLRRFIQEGMLQQDSTDNFYVYKQVMGDHHQVGLVAAASVEEYEQDLIKKHEFTRPEKENDRVEHMLHLNAQVGPVFLSYRADKTIDKIISNIMLESPEYDFASADGIRHIFWIVNNANDVDALQQAFQKISCLYVADGHHRSAAAMRVKQLKQAENTAHSGEESYNYFLTVIFPHNQMNILDYNRVAKDLNGLSEQEFLGQVSKKFTVTAIVEQQSGKPESAHCFGMYLGGRWYQLQALTEFWDDNDPVQRLDVSILQNNLLTPVLAIDNPRTDTRIDFVGGIRGMKALEKRVDSGTWQVAFALFPTSIDNLMAIADAGEIMPPKSTWFEPKLKSGLVTHILD